MLDPEYVKVSEYVIRVGMAHFYNHFFMLMTYSNIMLEVCNNYQTGTSQLQQAKKRTMGLSDKFAIFVREQVGWCRSRGGWQRVEDGLCVAAELGARAHSRVPVSWQGS